MPASKPKPGPTVVYTCCGCANTGQIANRVARCLTRWKIAYTACLAGIGAHDKGMIAATKRAGRIVAIDGCATNCARRTLEHAGIPVAFAFDIVEEGVEKNHDDKYSARPVLPIARRIKKILITPPKGKR